MPDITPSDQINATLQKAIDFYQAGQSQAAVQCLLEITAVDPGHAEANHCLALTYMSLQRVEEAIACLRQVVSSSPSSEVAQQNLAATLQGTNYFAEAIESYSRLLEANPCLTAAFYERGICYRELRKFPEAEADFQQVLQLNTDDASAYAQLGRLYQERGEKDRAVACYRLSIAIQPMSPSIHRALAMAQKFDVYNDDISEMEKLYGNPELESSGRMHLAYALGKVFDDLKDYDKAFDFYLEANELDSRNRGFSPELQREYVNGMKAQFSAAFTRPTPQYSENDSRLVFIVGMLRSGTSLTEQIIANHPLVHGVGESIALPNVLQDIERKTGQEFPNCVDQLSDEDWQGFGQRYLQQVRADAGDKPYVTDKLPGNYINIGAIARMFPDARIIHCRRNAMDTCVSMFQRHFPFGHDYTTSLHNLGLNYQSYKSLMTHWQDVVPDMIYDSVYEQLVADFEGSVRRILEFCCLPFDTACLEFYKSDRAVQTASFGQVHQPIYMDSVAAWKRFERQLEPLKKALGAAVSD